MYFFVCANLKPFYGNALAWVKKIVTLANIAQVFLNFSVARHFAMEWLQGQKLQTCRWFLHFFPGCWPLSLAVVEGYDSRREILSSESDVSYIGDHTIRMVESTAGFEYSDDVDIHAGLKTFFIWLYAKVFCRYQQARRRRLKSPL